MSVHKQRGAACCRPDPAFSQLCRYPLFAVLPWCHQLQRLCLFCCFGCCVLIARKSRIQRREVWQDELPRVDFNRSWVDLQSRIR